MSSCTVYYPGLLGPEVNLGDLANEEWPTSSSLPHLQQLLTRGRAEPRTRLSLEADILACMGVDYPYGSEIPVGIFRNSSAKSDISIWCLDPVCIRIDRDEALLVANETLGLTESESLSIINDLNEHFRQDGLNIRYHTEHQWLLFGELELSTSGIGEVMYRNIDKYQPEGKDASKWRSIINEAQMLMHAHPVNESRMNNGELTVNSLWLWGGGKHSGVKPVIDIVVTQDTMARDIAVALGIEYLSGVDNLQALPLQGKNSLILLTEQLRTIRNNDVFGWFEYLQYLDSIILTTLFTMIEKNKLDMLILISDTVKIKIGKKELRQLFWHRLLPTASLKESLTKFRTQYGF